MTAKKWPSRCRAIEIAGRAITSFTAAEPLDVTLVLYRPGIFRLAQMLLGWPTLNPEAPEAASH